MSVSYQIDVNRELIVCRIQGNYNNDDLIGFFKELADDPDFNGNYDEIVDGRAITSSEITEDGLRHAAKMADIFTADSHRALVVNAGLSHGLSRMFLTLNEHKPSRLRLFTEMSEALSWLGLDSVTQEANSSME